MKVTVFWFLTIAEFNFSDYFYSLESNYFVNPNKILATITNVFQTYRHCVWLFDLLCFLKSNIIVVHLTWILSEHLYRSDLKSPCKAYRLVWEREREGGFYHGWNRGDSRQRDWWVNGFWGWAWHQSSANKAIMLSDQDVKKTVVKIPSLSLSPDHVLICTKRGICSSWGLPNPLRY